MNIKTDKVGIIGSGSWATAIAKMLLENVREINWFFRKESTIEHFKRNKHNPRYLHEVEFDTSRINFFKDVSQLLSESDIVIIAVPSAYLPVILSDVNDLSGKYVLSGVKGTVTDENLLVAEYLNKYYT